MKPCLASRPPTKNSLSRDDTSQTAKHKNSCGCLGLLDTCLLKNIPGRRGGDLGKRIGGWTIHIRMTTTTKARQARFASSGLKRGQVTGHHTAGPNATWPCRGYYAYNAADEYPKRRTGTRRSPIQEEDGCIRHREGGGGEGAEKENEHDMKKTNQKMKKKGTRKATLKHEYPQPNSEDTQTTGHFFHLPKDRRHC